MALDGSTITITDLAYAAGFVDGEGYVSVKRAGYLREGWSRHYRLYISVANTNPLVIDWFKAKFGGSIKRATKRENPTHKPCYSWIISAKSGALFLKLITPYLIIKKTQAELCLTFQTTIRKDLGTTRLPAEILEQREQFYQDVKLLNKKGV